MKLTTKLIFIMSIDVFGRQLIRTAITRGPPGRGFKLTSDGQFDIENKRLSNVSDAFDLQDAVNVKFLQKVIEAELEKIFKIIEAQKQEIGEIHNNNNLFYSVLEQKFNNINRDITALQNKLQELEQEIIYMKNGK